MQLTRRPSTSSEFRRPGGPALHPSRARGTPSSRAPPPPAPWRDASSGYPTLGLCRGLAAPLSP
eukprot:597130-Alexandrium_andersonii.AAC.1